MWQNGLDLISLEVPDEMPLNVRWQKGLFVQKFLDAVFTEVACPLGIYGVDSLQRLVFGDDDQGDFCWGAACP
jgi:hypothetical protein